MIPSWTLENKNTVNNQKFPNGLHFNESGVTFNEIGVLFGGTNNILWTLENKNIDLV